MTTRAHNLLAVATFAPPEMRAEMLETILRENGPEALVAAFSDFIGIARQVIDNAHEAVAGAVGKDIANRINYPTLQGAMLGKEIAVDPVPGMCRDCAFREGTCPNQSVMTVSEAKDGPFWCHEGLTAKGKPTRHCAGWLKANAEPPQPKSEPDSAVQPQATAEGEPGESER